MNRVQLVNDLQKALTDPDVNTVSLHMQNLGIEVAQHDAIAFDLIAQLMEKYPDISYAQGFRIFSAGQFWLTLLAALVDVDTLEEEGNGRASVSTLGLDPPNEYANDPIPPEPPADYELQVL